MEIKSILLQVNKAAFQVEQHKNAKNQSTCTRTHRKIRKNDVTRCQPYIRR